MAAHLCDELDAEGIARLKELTDRNPEWRAMQERYLAVQGLLDRTSEIDLARAFGNGRSGGFSRGRVFAIAASLLIGVGAFAFYYTASGRGVSRTLAFPHGRCSSGGKTLRAGDSVGGDIESGADSFCDVRINDGGRVALRVFPNSRVEFISDKKNMHVSLNKGRVMLDAKKRSNRGLQIHAPGHTVRILGTKILVEHNSLRSVNVDLLDGKAEVSSAPYLQAPALQQGLPPETLEAARAAVPALFTTRVQVLDAGTRLRLRNDADQAKVTEAVAQAQAMFADLKAGTQGRPDGEQLTQEIIKRSKSLLKKDRGLAKSLGADKLRTEKETIAGKRRWLLERWSQGLTSTIETGDSQKQPATGRIVVEPGRVLRALQEEQPSRLLYRIHLKDGRVLTGIVEQEGSLYRLSTGEGDLLIARDQVKNLELFLDK